MIYSCFMTAFNVKDLEAQKTAVERVSNYYVKSQQTLTPAKWVFRNKRNWPLLKKAAFVYYTKQNPNYKNPHLNGK